MEAAAHGTPTIGYWVPGVRDSVVDGQTGLLADTDEEFVDNWIAVGTDVDLRLKLGEMAIRRADEFSWSATVDRFEDLAREAVGARGQAGAHHQWEPDLA
jgi:glycosyltransferase involved in cell wall biosynthesis